MTSIAFLGLGHMGLPMAGNLVNAGYSVRGFDPVPAAREAAGDKGIEVAATGAEAVAGADVVITMLPNGTLVKECYGEVMPTAHKGALFIDSSTIAVDDARAVHAYAAERGFAQLDAPVSGGVKGAVAGTLAFMVGGETEALDTARPVLEAMAGGTPVITSNISCMPEVGGDAAFYADPFSEESILEAMIKILYDQTLVKQQIEKGHKQSLLFTSSSCAEKVMKVYQSLHE
jgi:3-hydroxyisobutyrate dehydrogenase-like beta-hydroxyacid dehydrogenase